MGKMNNQTCLADNNKIGLARRKRIYGYRQSFGYARLVCPELLNEIQQLRSRYEIRRNRLLILYERGRLETEEFLRRFRDGASPLIEKVRSLMHQYESIWLMHQGDS